MRLARLVRVVLPAVLLIGPGLLAACNTLEGAGEDIKKAGQWIEEKAGDKK